MALLESTRLKPGDLDHWRRMEALDVRWARTNAFLRRVDAARAALGSFVETHHGRCYAGVSWGKDSVCVAHMLSEMAPGVPLVGIEVDGLRNPDIHRVRDAYDAPARGQTHVEIVVPALVDEDGVHATGTMEAGFATARKRFGDAHISGVRAAESWKRQARQNRWGECSPMTCAPLSRWSAADIYAYLSLHDLPVHPAYAMTLGGRIDRDRVRVAWIGLKHGTGVGRAEWERAYYPEVCA